MLFRMFVSLSLVTVAAGELSADSSSLTFRDVAEEVGLFPSAEGVHAHGAAWGDTDGDSFPELFLGTFHKPDSKPNMLFRNQGGTALKTVGKSPVSFSARVTGVVFADFDNDGDLDLYVGSMPKKAGKRAPEPMRGCALFENDGTGKFKDVSEGNGACPEEFGGRSVAVLDYDGDGLLDLAVAEDPIKGYNGSPTSSSRIFRNRGGLKFEDATKKSGIPEEVPGLGVAAADVNNDTLPDLYIAAQGGGNLLFLNSGGGKFKECPGTRELFEWPDAGGDNMVCGVCFGDVNRDGLIDIVIGQHFEKPWQSPVANKLFLNKGIDKGVPKFVEVTSLVGLMPLPMKAPHCEIQDFDNDGWPDIVTSIVKFDEKQNPHPVIFRHQGLKDDLPKFEVPALAVNKFPTAEDLAINRTGDFFDKMIADRQIMYTAPAPCADFDGDGRMDIFLGSWWTETRSLLLRNETEAGNWIRIGLNIEKKGVNRTGVGSRIEVYPAGQLAKANALLGVKEIATGYGYASGQPPLAHLGLGAVDAVDIRVILPHDKGILDFQGIDANQEKILSE